LTGLTWLAFSERERQQALELARSLQQRESRDELGIGSIRDAFADLLFPGTSTLQTRARYFLFIPWSYLAEAPRGLPRELPRRLRQSEERLIRSLIETCSPDEPGLIGRRTAGALQRMPSALYWQGLNVWGIRRVRGSQTVVERLMTSRPGSTPADDDGEPISGAGGAVWHPDLPDAPNGFPDGATFALTRFESDFLVQQLATERATRESMLAQLSPLDAAHARVDFAWQHPLLTDLTESMQATVEQARRFSLLMHGAAWLYNVVLAERSERSDLADGYRADFLDWAERAGDNGGRLVAWELDALWDVALVGNPRIPPTTQTFVRSWHQLLLQEGPAPLLDDPVARALVIDRERRMKGANARTFNARALEQWGGSSGTAPLDFRWGVARTLLTDIRAGARA
jgi:hypothetical protein